MFYKDTLSFDEIRLLIGYFPLLFIIISDSYNLDLNYFFRKSSLIGEKQSTIIPGSIQIQL